MRSKIGLLVAASIVAGGCADNSTSPIEQPVPEAELLEPTEVQEINARSSWRGWRPRKATVYVVHGINGSDLGLNEALPVDVSLNGACAIENFTFRTITDGIRLDAGMYDIRVHLGGGSNCAGDAAIEVFGAELKSRDNVTIVAHLSDGGVPTASIFSNDFYRRPWKPRAVARHTANFGAVDVLANGAVIFPGVLNGQQGAISVRRGSYDLAINIAGTDTEAWSATVPLKPFRYYVLYAVGTPGNGTFEVLVQVLPSWRVRWRF